jgi:hypothetical protein
MIHSPREAIMKAVEFETCLNPDQTLTVPPALAGAIPNDTRLRVLILIAENETEREWEQVAALDFGQGYADSDAIYDQLSAG